MNHSEILEAELKDEKFFIYLIKNRIIRKKSKDLFKKNNRT